MACCKPHNIWVVFHPLSTAYITRVNWTPLLSTTHTQDLDLQDIHFDPFFVSKTASQRDILSKETPVAASKIASEQSPSANVVLQNILRNPRCVFSLVI